MKKLMRLCLLFIAVLALCTSIANAQDSPQIKRVYTTYYEIYEDGSYSIISIEEIVTSQTGSRATKTGTKSRQYYNANGVLQLTVYVKGTFSYNGTTATATDAMYSYSIANTSWTFISGSASCSGATATATCTFRNTPTNYKTLSVSLTCSPTGVLS